MHERNDIEQIGCDLKIERLQKLIRFVIVSQMVLIVYNVIKFDKIVSEGNFETKFRIPFPTNYETSFCFHLRAIRCCQHGSASCVVMVPNGGGARYRHALLGLKRTRNSCTRNHSSTDVESIRSVGYFKNCSTELLLTLFLIQQLTTKTEPGALVLQILRVCAQALSHGWCFLSRFSANLDRNTICTIEIVIELCTKDSYSLFESQLLRNLDPNSEYSSFVQRSITLSSGWCCRAP